MDFILHLDKHLDQIVHALGPWSYVLLFVIVFCETGLVVTPFLPGDSLLFAVGALAASSILDIKILFPLFWVAAVLGDAANYAIGAAVGPKVFNNPKSKIFKKEYLDKTHAFYEKYGAKTIVMARFLPIVRTFAPFVAGVGRMNYLTFTTYNLIGATLWVCIFLVLGYFFGNMPWVEANFSLVILGIIIVSCLPPLWEACQHHRDKKKSSSINVESTPSKRS